MASISQIQRGFVAFVDNEVAPAFDGWKKAVVAGGAAVYSLASFVLGWFEKDLTVTFLFAVYMIIAYLGIFLIHKIKRVIDAKLLNNDLQRFQKRENKEC